MEKRTSLICAVASLAASAVTLVLAVVLLVGGGKPAAAEPTISPTPTVKPTPTISPAPAPAPSFAPAPPAELDADGAYRLEKLNQVSDMVLDRKVVPQDYLRYLDEDLGRAVERYNLTLGEAKYQAVVHAKKFADTFVSMKPGVKGYDPMYGEYGQYLEKGDNYNRFIEECATAFLYPNFYDFITHGTVSAYPAGSEAGGSGGLWATYFYISEDSPIRELEPLVKDLLNELDAARAAFGENIG